MNILCFFFIIASSPAGSQAYFLSYRSIQVNLSRLGAAAPSPAATQIQCAQRALTGANNVMCYGMGQCVTSVADVAVVQGEQTPGWTCMTSDVICLMPNKTALLVNQTTPDLFCPQVTRRCTELGFVTVRSSLQRCEGPFTKTRLGCTFSSTFGRTWCDARATCLGLGGDLISPRDSIHYADIRNYYQNTEVAPDKLWRDDYRCGPNFLLSAPYAGIPSQCNPNSEYYCCSPVAWCGHTTAHCCSGCNDYRTAANTFIPWLGVYRAGDSWRRTHDDALLAAGEGWAPGNPDTSPEMNCAYISPPEYGMASSACDAKRATICITKPDDAN